MAVHFNQREVPPQTYGHGARRQPLLTADRVPGTNILLDRVTLLPAGGMRLKAAAADIAWFQILDGDADLSGETGSARLSDGHVVFCPPGFSGTLTSRRGASLLLATVPDAARFDAGIAASPPPFRIVDWRREPVLDSQHDARKRIYLVTPKLFGHKVIKGEMIIYPPGTKAANHHHEGAEHFMYFLRGKGTAWANEQPFAVQAGDLVYYHDHERHYLQADDDCEMAFAEFFVPAEFKTVWVDEAEVCTWLPTGRDIRGGTSVREIAAHDSATVASPAEV